MLVRDKLTGLKCRLNFESILFTVHHLGREYLLLVRLQMFHLVLLSSPLHLSLLLEVVVGLLLLLFRSLILIHT